MRVCVSAITDCSSNKASWQLNLYKDDGSLQTLSVGEAIEAIPLMMKAIVMIDASISIIEGLPASQEMNEE